MGVARQGFKAFFLSGDHKSCCSGVMFVLMRMRSDCIVADRQAVELACFGSCSYKNVPVRTTTCAATSRVCAVKNVNVPNQSHIVWEEYVRVCV
jgi:hypothetical protein